MSSAPGNHEPRQTNTIDQKPPETRSFSAKAHETASNTYRLLRIVVFAAFAVIATIFVLRNWNDVPVDYVFGDVNVPLAMVMLVSVGVGAVLALLGRWLWFRS